MSAPALRRILGIDPSLNEAAAALLEEDPARPDLGRLLGGFRVRPDGTTLAERATSLGNLLIDLVDQHDPSVIVLETPADHRRGGRMGYRGRSVMTAPLYGMAVGAAVMALELGAASHSACPEVRLLYPSVNDWTGGDVPSSKGDKHKTKRAKYVSMLYRVPLHTLGPVSIAGNVADAVLIARWGLWASGRTKG